MNIYVFTFIICVVSQLTYYKEDFCGCEKIKSRYNCDEVQHNYVGIYCEWSEEQCIPMNFEQVCNPNILWYILCEDRIFPLGFDKGIRCKLDGENCISERFTCQTGTRRYGCPSDMGCYWNKFEKCSTFTTCSDYIGNYNFIDGIESGYKCPPRCRQSISNEICEDFNCKIYKTESECIALQKEVYLDKHLYCDWSNDGVCEEVEQGNECSNYNKHQRACKIAHCTYNSQKNQCQTQKCSDLEGRTLYDLCTFTGYFHERTMCTWKNNTCIEQTLEQLKENGGCGNYQFNFYKNDKQECIQCSAQTNNQGQTNTTEGSTNQVSTNNSTTQNNSTDGSSSNNSNQNQTNSTNGSKNQTDQNSSDSQISSSNNLEKVNLFLAIFVGLNMY